MIYKVDDMDRRYLLAISAIAVISIIYLLFVINNQYIHPTQCQEITNRSTFLRERNILPIPLFIPLPFIIGVILFLLIPVIILYSNMQVEKKISASAELLSRLIDKHDKSKRTQQKSSIGKELIARLMEPNEMAIVEKLIKQQKGIQQSEIAKMPGMTKLKAHRIVERLKQKGIIIVQKIGKTNQIKLDSRTRSLLSALE